MFGSSLTWDNLLSLQNAFEQAMKGKYLGGTTAFGVTPPINLFHKEENLVLIAELPGLQKEKIHIEVKGNLLRLAGKRELTEEAKASAHRLERKQLEFDRTIKLPFEIEDESVTAEYRNGLLIVHLPRAKSDKPKTIQVD